MTGHDKEFIVALFALCVGVLSPRAFFLLFIIVLGLAEYQDRMTGG